MTHVTYVAPSSLLSDLGITEPHDIDIEAIAESVGATVVYERLRGCEARIIGTATRAIITVKADAPRPRQRFSIGHELGHWMHDRGRIAFACEHADIASPWDALLDPEARANRYAANLLLPAKMFKTECAAAPIEFATVRRLTSGDRSVDWAGAFQTSGASSYRHPSRRTIRAKIVETLHPRI